MTDTTPQRATLTTNLNKTCLTFKCPGCGSNHTVDVAGSSSGRGWTWNGDLTNVTLSPSVLVRRGHYCSPGEKLGNCACDFQERYPEEEPWPWPCVKCHSYVTDGRIKFLGDCTHALVNQTVDLPPVVRVNGNESSTGD